MTSFSFSHFPPNYQKVSHERTIKSNFHSRITLKKKGGPNEFCGRILREKKKALKERTIFQHSRKIVTNVRLNVKTIYLLLIFTSSFQKRFFGDCTDGKSRGKILPFQKVQDSPTDFGLSKC